MKIVITGALGHIGSKLMRVYAHRFPNSKLVLIDSLLTQRYCSLFDLPTTSTYEFIEGDIRKLDMLPAFEGASVVIHLAAITDAANSFEHAGLVTEVNLEGTRRVAEACIAANVPLIFPSTTSVYGSQSEVVDESCGDEDLKPQSPYAESKLKAEKLLISLGQEKGLKFVTCRLGTIFGTSVGMRFHTAINKFCWQAVMGTPISVWRTALNQNRPYLELGDAIRAFEFIIEKRMFDGQTYNVVTTNSSVGDIVEIIRRFIPDLRVEYVDSKIMNQLSYHVKAEKIKAMGFELSGDLRSGIDETLSLLKGVQNQHNTSKEVA